MNRKEIENNLTCITKGNFGKPDLNRVEVGGRSLMVKDVRRKNFFLRWTLGLWLIHKEWKIYCWLRGTEGIPQPFERIDRFAFVMEFIPGRPLLRGEPLPSSFFSDLEQVLREVHTRGVVHLDLRHKGNILLSERGEPFLIDFQGMRFGSLFYDLGSLLCDPYVNFSDGQRDELLSFYYGLLKGGLDQASFRNYFWEASAQRLMQALGAYGFLGLKKGLKTYLEHIPAGLRNLQLAALKVTSLPRLRELCLECQKVIEANR